MATTDDNNFSDRGKYHSWTKEDLINRILELELEATGSTTQNDKRNRSFRKRQFNWENISKRHILLKFLYMGWEYHGYASQVTTPDTVEEHLMTALKKCCLIQDRESSNYHRCGRTDSGVSAFAQVISIDVRSKQKEPNETNTADELDYCKMLNGVLPVYIRCYSWAHVSQDVSARFDCTSRSYNYFFPKGILDISAMRVAAKSLEGRHDFRNLCKMDVNNGVVEFVRTIDSAEIEPYSNDVAGKDPNHLLLILGQPELEEEEVSGKFQMMVLRIKSSGFLWHQIRCIMAVLMLVGEGHEAPEIVEKLLDVSQQPCKPQYPMAIALPLSLAAAEYDNHDLQWSVADDEHLISQLQSLWTEFSVKSMLVREAMRITNSLRKEAAKWQRQTSLYCGVVSKVHIPLMKRPTSKSLEERVQGVEAKKRRLEKDTSPRIAE